MLYDKLKNYAASGAYPMHMPGHKRNTDLLPVGLPYGIDITEIHGFDDLHDPRGVLKETAEIAARLYGSDRAFPLINGSTAGILAAIGAHAGRGDKAIVAQNCHRSVFNAIDLFGIEPVLITPEMDEAAGIACSIDPASIEAALDSEAGVKLVVVTSPTYEGVVSDINSIAAVVHRRGIPLLVDEAHGAHLGFSGLFPDNAVNQGADVVVMSLHKTLPALTQCSLLHICGEFASVGEISRLLAVFQTSSPSYVLMSSIDSCLRLLDSDKDVLFLEYERNLKRFSMGTEVLEKLYILGQKNLPPVPFFAFDPGKIVVVTKKTAISGFELMSILRDEYKIELEMASPGYAVAMTSVCDTAEGFGRLAEALVAIDREMPRVES